MKKYLYYCPDCKLRFQHQNFGHGYPELNAEGTALCPYCSHVMLETLDAEFPADWIEERLPAPQLEDQSAPPDH